MTLSDGQIICNGKYEVLRLIGEGGQSRVWLAREVKRGLEVAIKEPLPVLSTLEREALEMRFQRELRISGRLLQIDAPNVVRVWTVEEHEGQTLLVMEYCAGGSLAERLRGGPLPIEEAVRITLQLCAALDIVHEKLGLVHRDIKPSNVLFSAERQAKLADFGLAQTGESQRSGLTGAGHPGTPGYKSPEQEETKGYLTPASDVYSLGCVLFEMLTGSQYQRQRPGTPASTLRPEVAEWLDAVLAQALQKDAWERYSRADEMAAALRAGADGWQPRTDAQGAGVGLERGQGARARAPRSAGEESTAPAAGATRVLQKAGITLVYVPRGEFWMGSPDDDADAFDDEKPQHKVQLDGFWIGQTEVTNAQYRRFIEDGGYTKREYWTDEGWRWNGSAKAPAYWDDDKWNPPGFPVVGVSWYEAAAFARWAGARLPTEAEWEYAARGGPLSQGYRYAGSNDAGEVAWYDKNSNEASHPVGQKRPNELGLYDMSGNVWEWCQDWYGGDYYRWSPASNPGGPPSGEERVLRGGSWSSDERFVRCAYRDCSYPDDRFNVVGFRVAE